MKKIILYILISYHLCIIPALSQYGWVWQNPLPQGNHLSYLQFVNPLIGYTSGDCGTILKTTDGGFTWSLQSTLIQKNINAVFFSNELTGYAVGDTGTIICTKNGAGNWFDLFIETRQNLRDIKFTNTNYGIIVGDSGLIARTTNNGKIWNKVASGFTYALNAVSFTNTMTGFAAGTNGILKTTDGGLHWNSILSNYNFTSICFINDSLGYATGSGGLIMTTTNRGISWQPQNLFLYSFDLNDIHFLNAATGFVCGFEFNTYGELAIFRTTNGGQNWIYWSDHTRTGMNSIYTIDPVNSVSVGSGGKIIRTSNGGINWGTISAGTENEILLDVKAIDSNVCYAAGGNPYYSAVMMKTTNGGQNWITQNLPSTWTIYALEFANANTGTAVGLRGTLLRTTNGGMNWVHQTTPSPNTNLNDVSFINLNTGMALGTYAYSTYLIKTTNGGTNWVEIDCGYNGLEEIWMCNENIVYMIVNNNTGGARIIKSTNGGYNWIQLSISIQVPMFAIQFLNINTGFITGYSGRIMKTTNGGANWDLQTSGTSLNLSSVNFSDSLHGNCVGAGGIILQTTNSGNNWVKQNIPTTKSFCGVYFINNITGWIVGEDRTILHTTNAGNLVGLNSVNNNLPEKFALYQNYPNPFNPATKIKFDISGTSAAQTYLYVYDILGREITVLVNKQLQPGTYEVNFDGSSFPSGVYFCRITAGSFTGVKKMVLLK